MNIATQPADRKLKILHLEDSSSDAELVNRVLKKGTINFEREVVDTRNEYISALAVFSPDIVLSDHSLPSFNSHEALAILQETGMKIPFILITANVSEEFAVDVIKRGADDYILKDRLQRLPSAIHNALEKYRFEKERQSFIDDLIKNESRFRALIENSSDGMAIFSAEGKPQYVSPSIKNVLGFTSEEAMKLELTAIAHPDDAPKLGSLMQQALAHPGFPYKGGPFRMMHKDGRWRWVEGILTNMLHDPYIKGIVDNFRDISSRVEAEILIRESEEKYRAFYNNSPDGILLTVTDGEILSANPAACEIFQMSEAEICEAGRYGLVDTADPRIEVAIKERQIKGRVTAEITCIRKDHSRFPAELTSVLFKDGGGNERTSLIIRDVAGRKAAEELARKSERQYRHIVETAQEGIWLVDKEDRTIFVNNKLCEFLEYSKEEILGKQPGFFMDDEGKGLALAALQSTKDGLRVNLDLKYLSKSGKELWGSASANGIYDTDGTYTGSLSMISDVTDKKLLEQLYAKATSLSRIGSFEIDLIKNEVYWSPMTKEIHEVDQDFVPDLESALNFYEDGSSREMATAAVKNAIENGDPYDLELPIITAKGNTKWVRAIGQAEYRNGNCTSLSGSFQDIDKIKKTEFEILQAYEEKDVILDSIGDGFFAIDLSWTVTYWNRHAEKLFECAREKIINQSFWSVFSKSEHRVYYDHYKRALKTNKRQNFETYHEDKARWFDVTVYPSPGGLSVYFKNITDKKASEFQLLELNRNLQTYTKELVISNTELEQFSYIISHNLRSPVANIIGLAEELKDQSHSEETKEMLNDALSTSVVLLNDVIIDLNTILTVKKEVSEKKEMVDLPELVDRIQLSIKRHIETENVILTTDFSEIEKLKTLKSYLHSVLFSLISNSIKYKRANLQPIIQIRSNIDNDHAVITFKDNGLGIDLVKRKNQVFGLYKRFHNHIDGKGMGLFMVKTQVETMGGSISIKSEVNQGTEFKIRLPLE